ncbi:MAG TPA: hypothetical protein VFU30_00245 [Gaiellaceae bacterium]|nr:hypothetical protein [Gaiellaceae bacterium]
MSADSCGCGCCAPPSGAAPLPVDNPPGLPAVGYRIGTYATFREALIRRLAQVVALRGLTTRADDDYAIAVLDGWSVIADILTFYSERTVNEAFLRTAKLRDSVVRLSGLVGYDPNPGLAATAFLAYALERGTSFTIPAGARVQSVPPPGDDSPPVKFETLADLQADAALNRVPLVAPPQSTTPLAAGVDHGLFPPGFGAPDGVRIGATLAAWSDGLGEIELKRVEDLTPDGPLGGIAWSPPLQQARDHLAVVTRTLHVFGHDAPDRVVTTTYDATAKEFVPSETVRTDADFAVAASTTVDLDREVPDLRVGVELLVLSPGAAPVRATVTGVARTSERFDPLQGTVTRVTLSQATPPLDRRTVELYELAGDVPLWDHTAPEQIDGATLYAPLDPAAAPAVGRAVELVDGESAYDATVVSATAAPDLPGHLAIVVSPGPAAPLEAATAALLGNVVRGSQGESVAGEFLGTGDASVPNQRFKLAKPPITRVPSPGAPHGGASTLVVRVDGVQWQEAEYLYGHGADDRVFVVELEDDGSAYVRFGDGVIGARVPTGAQVTADYRHGLGTPGNVGAATLTSPLTRPKGLRSVTNPLAASGGGDPETIEVARLSAPATVRTFERIVSLQDAEDQARENAMVGKATASWADGVVTVTVAGAGGAELGPSQLDDLQADLDARRDPNRPLVVRGYRPVALSITVKLIAVSPDRAPKDVKAAVEAALLAHFAFAARAFGQPVRLSEVFVAAQDIDGVLGVDVDRLTLADAGERAAHFLGSADVNERVDLRPDELALLDASNLTVTVAT